jgi:hypothetical protein
LCELIKLRTGPFLWLQKYFQVVVTSRRGGFIEKFVDNLVRVSNPSEWASL